ncbi:hypothetical protein ACXU4B_10865 [Dyella soli]|uniref:Uncharacterized protein n=1 Tax=Dyella soli TaxID=522319 RepID=A0A4R0YGM0_9GAMM|nr:hypothetical protein [Dyella soli]TCI07323.1 hypothetical protein EZM97_32555 [Dyella soli]
MEASIDQGGVIVSVQPRYLAVALLIGVYALVLPWAVQWLVPGGEHIFVGLGALLAVMAIIAVLALLVPKVRAAVMTERHRVIFYASTLVIALYLGWAGSLLLRPISE